LKQKFFLFHSRFQFTREEIQAFREEHEQRNGDLTKPDDDSSNKNTRPSALKRPIDLRWSVNLKEPLPSSVLNGNHADETFNNYTPIEILRDTRDPENPNYDSFTYQLVIKYFILSNNIFFLISRLFFERDQILENVQELMQSFDNDVSLLYYLKIIKTLRAKETDLRLEIIIFFLGFLFSFYFI
jgi:hypothetical protein